MSFNCSKKINLNHSFNDYLIEDLKLDIHMAHTHWQKYGLSLKEKSDFDPSIAITYEVTDKIKSDILSTIPPELLDIEIPHVWYLEVSGSDDETTMVPPHIDKFRMCTINYYLNTNGEVTYFYKYESGKMEEIESFCSNKNECWILNTKVPHSVKLIPNKSRQMLGVSFINTPFEKVVSFFP